MQKEKVETGDVIYIEANSGAVKRQGRSDSYATEYDLEVINVYICYNIYFTYKIIFKLITYLLFNTFNASQLYSPLRSINRHNRMETVHIFLNIS